MTAKFLLNCPHFAGLPEQIQATLNQQATHFEYPSKRVILRPEDPWQTLYWITSGVIRMYYLDVDGKEHNKSFFSDNDFFWPVTESLRAEKPVLSSKQSMCRPAGNGLLTHSGKPSRMKRTGFGLPSPGKKPF